MAKCGTIQALNHCLESLNIMSNSHKINIINNQRIANQIKKTNSLEFYDLLNGPELSGTFKPFVSKHRNRIYPTPIVLSMFMSQVLTKDSSCQKAVDDFNIKRMAAGLPEIGSSTAAYCKARKGLSLDLIASLNEAVSKQICDHVPSQWKLKGRNSRLVDGTTMLMPDTEENQMGFPQQPVQKEGLGFPICRMVIITCLETGALINSSMSSYLGKQTGETSLLRNIMNSLDKGDILLGDAIYSSYFDLLQLLERGIDYLFEQNGPRQRNVNFSLGKKLGGKDHIIKIEKPRIKPEWMAQEAFNSAPKFLMIREFKAGGKVLITSMLDAKEMPKKMLGDHYKKRWSIELDIRNVKTTMGMEMLSCKTPNMVIKEVCVYLLAYNIIRLLMMQSALISDILPREISFKHCIHLWLAWCQQVSLNGIEKNTEIFILMAQRKVGNRPGRVEPRAIKRRPKAYSLLMRPRAEMNADIREFGHPQKSK